MPSPTEQIDQTFDALQKVDVSDIMISMALGVARAQEKLDDNTIKQLAKLATTGSPVTGKTLLELGFVPAFYAFDYVDISASIFLTVTSKNSTNFRLKAKLDYASTKGYTKEDVDILEKSKDQVSRKDFKSSRSLIVRAKETKSVKIQNRTMKMDQTKGSIKMVEDFCDEMMTSENIARSYANTTAENQVINQSTSTEVNVRNNNGYITVYIPPTTSVKYGILKVKTHAITTEITLSNNNIKFLLGTTYATTLANAMVRKPDLGNSGDIIGFSRKSTAGFDGALSMFYAHNHDRYISTYSESTYSNATVDDKMAILIAALKNDPNMKISITGYTDSSGTPKYNADLGQRRANFVKDILLNAKVNSAQIVNCTSDGEVEATKGTSGAYDSAKDGIKDVKFRRVVIQIENDADYYYFQGASFNNSSAAAPAPSASVDDKFIYLSPASFPPVNYPVRFSYNNTQVEITATSASDYLHQFSNNTSYKDDYLAELRHNTVYLMHKETKIEFVACNLQDEQITIENVSETSGVSTENQNTWMFDETKNKEYELKKDAEKIEDPSTFTAGASIDLRTSRQFDVTATGNASFMARLKSVPIPGRFQLHINQILNGGQ